MTKGEQHTKALSVDSKALETIPDSARWHFYRRPYQAQEVPGKCKKIEQHGREMQC